MERRSSILLHDVYSCPLSVYIDVICDGKLSGLAIKGNPTPDELEEAKFRLITDFSELAGGGEAQVITEATSNFYRQQNLLSGFELSLRLILSGRFEKAIIFLNENGLKCEVPANENEFQSLVKRVEMKIKNRLAKYKESRSQFNSLSKGGERPTRKYYNRLLVILSTCEVIKMQLNPKKLTVAEFAEYINLFNEYQNQLKISKTKRS